MRRALLVGLSSILVLGCGGDGDSDEAANRVADPGAVHVHGLGRDPADGRLMIATHTGLFRARDNAQPVRVAGFYQDTMGFTVVGPRRFLGSGHPGENVGKDPPYLGLIESRDAGETWRPISLRGKVDLHVLESQGDVVYGYGSDFESRSERFLRSDDGGRTWTRLDPPEPLVSLAIDPTNARRVVALGERGGFKSINAGRTWRPIDVPGGLVTWTRELGLTAIDADGTVRRTQDPDDSWQDTGTLGGTPAALEGIGGELLAATHDSRVLSSTDGGASWSPAPAVRRGRQD